MDCQVPDDFPTLQELIDDGNEFDRNLAKRYIELGFKPEDVFCDDCFGK